MVGIRCSVRNGSLAHPWSHCGEDTPPHSRGWRSPGFPLHVSAGLAPWLESDRRKLWRVSVANNPGACTEPEGRGATSRAGERGIAAGKNGAVMAERGDRQEDLLIYYLWVWDVWKRKGAEWQKRGVGNYPTMDGLVV